MELSREGIKFITEETLDVDLCSPLDGQEEWDSAVYPVEPNERKVVQAVDINVFLGENESSGKEQASQWSPLSPEKLQEVMKEANMLASQLEKCHLREKENGSGTEIELETVPECEPLPFIRLLHEEKPSFRKTRRRTFDVKNSLLKALLPTVGPETCSAHNSPKALCPKQGGRASCSVDLPSSKKLQNKSKTYSAEDQLSKKTGTRQSLRASTVMKSGTKKSQATLRSSRKDRPLPLSGSDAAQHQQFPVHLKTLPQTNRKTEGTAGKGGPFKEPQLSHKDSSRKGTALVAHMKRKSDPRLFSPETRPLKKSLATPEKAVPLRKANANQSKTMGGDSPQLQPVSKPHRGSCQIQSSRSAMSPLASRLPVPKAASCMAALGRHTEAVSGRPSQLQLLNLGVPGGKGSAVSTPARKKGWQFAGSPNVIGLQVPAASESITNASAFQQTASSGLSQNRRLWLPKKETSGN